MARDMKNCTVLNYETERGYHVPKSTLGELSVILRAEQNGE